LREFNQESNESTFLKIYLDRRLYYTQGNTAITYRIQDYS